MEAYEPFISLGLALVVGALLGLEREQSQPDREKAGEPEPIGGIRTYPLFSLLGGVSALLARHFGGWILAIAFVAVAAFLVAGYLHDLQKHHDRGLTSEGAFLLAFTLGALSLTEDVVTPLSRKVVVISAIAVVVTLLLSLKLTLHRFVSRTTKEDVFATLKFLIVAVVVLPLLPNQAYGPLAVLNPFQIGLMVVFIAGISFVGYLAVRVMGPRRGLAITGLLGGLASSTAVTLNFSGRAKGHAELRRALALGIVLASTIMFARVLIEVAVLNLALLRTLWPVVGAMAVASLAYCGWLFVHARRPAEGGEVKFHNPFELTSAIKFAAIYALVLLASKAAASYAGSGGTYLAGMLAGLTDVDAITLSMARLAQHGEVSNRVAAITIVIGTASNTLVKAALASFIGGWAFGRYVALAVAASLLAGGIALAVQGLGGHGAQ